MTGGNSNFIKTLGAYAAISLRSSSSKYIAEFFNTVNSTVDPRFFFNNIWIDCRKLLFPVNIELLELLSESNEDEDDVPLTETQIISIEIFG